MAFQSTLPIQGVTNTTVELANAKNISIHTPNTGSDGICDLQLPSW